MGLRILLAEDEPVTRMTAQALLARAGHAVTAVADGPAAVAAAEGQGFDLILMDLGLPGLDGDEAVRRIRALPDPRRAATRILMLTATAVAADRERCRTCGADGVLAKPLRLEALGGVEDARAAAFETAFDEAPLRQMREMLPPDRVVLLVEKAVAALEQYRTALEAARAAGDRAAAGMMAHKIAGVAGQYGCAGLRRAARALEAGLETDTASEAPHRELEAAFASALSWLRSGVAG